MTSLPVVCGGIGRSVCLCRGVLGISGGLHRRRVRPAPVLKCFLFVLLQGASDSILDQSPADPQKLRLIGLRKATST